jgi:hypothetical protein
MQNKSATYLGAGDCALHKTMGHSVNTTPSDVQAKRIYSLKQKALEILTRTMTNHLDDNLLFGEVDMDLEQMLHSIAARIVYCRAHGRRIRSPRRRDQLLLCDDWGRYRGICPTVLARVQLHARTCNDSRRIMDKRQFLTLNLPR